MFPVGATANAPPNAHPVGVNVSLPGTSSERTVQLLVREDTAIGRLGLLMFISGRVFR